MERVLSKPNHRTPKQAKKARREPVKVVYISTPVWVEATAAEFRARVIELTGRDSNLAEHPVAATQSGVISGADGPMADPSSLDIYNMMMFDGGYDMSLFYEPQLLGGSPRSLDHQV